MEPIWKRWDGETDHFLLGFDEGVGMCNHLHQNGGDARCLEWLLSEDGYAVSDAIGMEAYLRRSGTKESDIGWHIEMTKGRRLAYDQHIRRYHTDHMPDFGLKE